MAANRSPSSLARAFVQPAGRPTRGQPALARNLCAARRARRHCVRARVSPPARTRRARNRRSPRSGIASDRSLDTPSLAAQLLRRLLCLGRLLDLLGLGHALRRRLGALLPDAREPGQVRLGLVRFACGSGRASTSARARKRGGGCANGGTDRRRAWQHSARRRPSCRRPPCAARRKRGSVHERKPAKQSEDSTTDLSLRLMSATGIGAGAFLAGALIWTLDTFLTGTTSSSLSSSLLDSFLTTFLFFLSALRSARDSSGSSSSTVFCKRRQAQGGGVSPGARRRHGAERQSGRRTPNAAAFLGSAVKPTVAVGSSSLDDSSSESSSEPDSSSEESSSPFCL